MTSVGIQADISDTEGILGVVRSFREQLREIQDVNRTLIDLRKLREASIQSTLTLSERLSDNISELLNGAQTMETLLNEDADAVNVCNKELEDLLNENERLDLDIGVQDRVVTDNDVDNEQRLTGFVEAELYRKLEDLSNLHTRLSEAEAEYQKEWDEFKSETSQFDTERSRLDGVVDHLKELNLARCVGLYAGSTDGREELAKRFVTNHMNEITHRQLQQSLNVTRTKETDLERELGSLVKQKRELWRRCLDLENCLEELKDTSDETNMLRPTAAYTDLPEVIEGRYPSLSSSDLDLTDAQEQSHGRMLHRCHKQIHLAIDLMAEEQQEIETAIKEDAGPCEPERISQNDLDLQSDAVLDPSADEDMSRDQDNDIENAPNKEALVKEVINKIQEHLASTNAQESQDQTTSDTAAPSSAEDAHLSMVAKLRKRVGALARTSSLRGLGKSLTATGSSRHFEPRGGGGGGKRRR